MKIIKKDVLSSTNLYLKENAETLDNYTIVTAKYQTSGKGRLTRVWESNDNENILMSLLLKEFKNCNNLSLLSLVVGYSTCKFLKKYLTDVKIKWPNDILVNSKKICGILLEGRINNQKQTLIIGIGININQIKFHDEIDNITTSLKKETNRDYDVGLLIEEFAEILINDIELYLTDSKNSYIDYIRNNLYGINETVSYTLDNNTYEGKIVDICDDGRLMIKKGDEILFFNSGEIKIKR